MFILNLKQFDAINHYVGCLNSKKRVKNKDLDPNVRDNYLALRTTALARLNKQGHWIIDKSVVKLFRQKFIRIDETQKRPVRKQGEQSFAFEVDENICIKRLYYVYAKNADEAKEKINDYNNVYKEMDYGDPKQNREVLDYDVKMLVFEQERSKSETENKVKTIIANCLGLEEYTIELSSTPESLGMDSLDEIELIMILEEKLNIGIDDHEAMSFKTVEDIVIFVERNRRD